MGIPDEADLRPAASWKVWRQLHEVPHPDLVVVDEVTSALQFCRHILDAPCVFLTDWFFADFGKPELDQLLNSAAEIMLLDFTDAHPAAIQTKAKITRLGPVVEEFNMSRPVAQRRLGFGGDSSLTTIVSLGGMTERAEVARMLERTLEAWNRYACPDDRLFILAPEPNSFESSGRHPGVEWIGFTECPELYYAAADVVITDALGFTNCELVYNQIPVVAFRVKAVVEEYAESFSRRIELLRSSGAITVADDEASPDQIWQAIDCFRAPRSSENAVHRYFSWASPRSVAELILHHLPS
jgi:UDP-N-acetylglucosamine:LPS N-acetylglucosamine transferase